MKKRKIQKLEINKSTVSQLTQDAVKGGGTHTCHGHSCCPTEAATCANTCVQTCANTCDCATNTCGSGSEPTFICPTIQLPV